jgi:hypothetical protein
MKRHPAPKPIRLRKLCGFASATSISPRGT